MPRKTVDPIDEESLVGAAVQRAVQLMPGVQFFAGVSRKANIGNFETIDVYSGLALPIGYDGELTEDSLRLIASEAAEIGFGIVSAETFDRYSLIKELNSSKR